MNDKLQAAFDKVMTELKSLTIKVPLTSETALFVERCVHSELAGQGEWSQFRVIFKDRNLSLWEGDLRKEGWQDLATFEQDGKQYNLYPSPHQI